MTMLDTIRRKRQMPVAESKTVWWAVWNDGDGYSRKSFDDVRDAHAYLDDNGHTDAWLEMEMTETWR